MVMSMRIRVATVLVVLLGVIAPLVPSFSASASGGGGGQIFTDYTIYGANATIYASGDIDYVTNCPAGGINDFITPAASVYVLRGNPTLSNGESLAGLSVAGGPSATIVSFDGVGDFLDEIIGFSQPSGALGSGSYEVVLDECQDGAFNAATDETFLDAITVRLPTVVPPVDPTILAIKADAQTQADRWAGGKTNFAAIMAVQQALSEASDFAGLAFALESGNVADVVDAGASWAIDEGFSQVESSLTPNLQPAVEGLMTAEAAKYEDLHNDPPDPNYRQVTTMPAQQTLTPDSSDPLLIAAANLGTAASTETAVTQAFIDALQRYEGAAQAGDGTWALIHAREMQQYASLLAGDLSTTSDTLNAAASAITSYPINLDQVASNLEYLRNAVQTNGFTPAQQQALVNAGFTTSQINQLQVKLSSGSFAITEAQTVSALHDIATTNTTEAVDLTNFAANTQAVINALAADPTVTDDAPSANAGGPYSGTVGTPIALNASGSTTGTGGSAIVSYQWDTQGNGNFTTSGETVNVTYSDAFQGMVGVKVTNADGISSVSYAPLTVTTTNHPPQITSFSPNTDQVTSISLGSTQAFSVTAQGTGGDPVNVRWQVDGSAAGSGANFDFTPVAAGAGARLVQAVATDATDPGAGSTTQSWLVAVCPAPAPPRQPTAVAATPGDAQATITWTAPAESCGNAVTGYVVIASTGQSATLPADATGVNFLGLTNGIPVSFTVAARNAYGAGQPSIASPTVTPGGTTQPPPPGNLTLTQIGGSFPSPIGIDWYEPTNEVVASVNYSGGYPNNFDLVDANGNFATFSSVKQVGGEVYLTAIQTSSCEAGFMPGDVYFGTFFNGNTAIARITHDGTVVDNPWITLPNENSPLQGGLFQDVYCVANGDLIATTESGNVWRVTSSGVATKIAGRFGASWLEGPTTVPNDPVRYGPWAGKIIAADESNGAIWSIDPNSTFDPNLSNNPTSPAPSKWLGGSTNLWSSAEGVRIIPANENFFGVDYGSGHIEGLPASDFNSMVGDVLLWGEFGGRLVDIKWNPVTASFVSLNLLKTNASQWEGATFAGAGLPGVSSTLGLSCIASTSTAQLGTLVKLTGELVNVANPGGIPISLVDSGANPQTATISADGGGVASFSLAGSKAGSETVVLTADVGGQTLTSNPCDVTWQGTSPGVLTDTGPTSGDFGDNVTLSAHLVDGMGGAITSAAVVFDLGTQSCTGTSDSSGDASCDLTIDQPPGPVTVTATYTDQTGWYATDSAGFTITPEETVLTYTGPNGLDYHDQATVSATLTSDDNVPIGNQPVAFTLHSTETCSGVTAADGTVSCNLTSDELAGADTLAITYIGDAAYQATGTNPTVPVQLEETSLRIISAATLGVGHTVVLAKLLEDSDATMPLIGKTVQFTATPTGGGSPVTGSGTVQVDGVADAELALTTGTYNLEARFTSDGYYASATDSQSLTVAGGQHQAQLTYSGDTSGDYNDSVTLAATLSDPALSPPAPVPGESISFTLGDGSGAPTCTGMTNDTGTASCSVMPNQPDGSYTITISFAGDGVYPATSITSPFQVLLEQTALAITSPNTLAAGNVMVSGTLTEDGQTPISGRAVVFTATPNNGGAAVTGNGTTDANGNAIASLTLPSGDYRLAANFAGDDDYLPADATSQTHLYVYQPSQFVIWGGNPPGTASKPNISVGSDYTFWGAQWSKQVMGGSYNGTSSFKGYADRVSSTTWTANPGNSSNPPSSIAPYIGVIVTTTVTKKGSSISGNVTEVVVIQVDNPSGYQPNPGHPASGILVAVVH